MDKDRDEHLVALQRLENELRLVRERVALALPHLEGHKFFAYHKTSLGGTLGGAASIAEDLEKLKLFWKDLDHPAIDELAEAAGTVAAYVERFLGLRSQGRKVGKQEAKSMFWDIHSHIKSMSKGRSELDVRRVHAIFDRAGLASTSLGVESDQVQPLLEEEPAPERADALRFSDEIEAHRDHILRIDRRLRLFDHPDNVKCSIVAVALATILSLYFNEGVVTLREGFGVLLAIAMMIVCLAELISDVISHCRSNESLKARAQLLEVASNYIRQAGGHVTSDAIVDLIAYAWSHRDDWTTKPKEIARKTEELKALIGGTPPSGPTATATQ